MFPIIISSLLSEEEKNSKKIPVLKLTALLILALILILPWAIERTFKSKRSDFSVKSDSIIGISVVRGQTGGGSGMCCNCCAGGSGGGGCSGGGGGGTATSVGPGMGPGVMGTEASATLSATPAVGNGLTATTPSGQTVSGQVVGVVAVTGVPGVSAIATMSTNNGLVGVAISTAALSGGGGGGGGCVGGGCVASVPLPETCPPGSNPSPNIPLGCQSVKTIPAP